MGLRTASTPERAERDWRAQRLKMAEDVGWLLLHVSPTYNVLRHMYIVLPDDLAKGKRLVGGIVPVVTVVVVDPVVIVVAGVV